MIRWLAKWNPGEREQIVHFTDVLPTLVDLCELKFPAGGQFDGGSMESVLNGEGNELPQTRFWQWNRYLPLYSHNAALRAGDWKLVRPYVTREIPEGESTLSPVLYNLKSDPAESRDVSREYPQRTARMASELEQWADTMERDRTDPEFSDVPGVFGP